MTIQSSASSVTYTGNSSATTFPFSFKIPSADQLVVSLYNLTTLVETELDPSVYGVNGVGDDLGGFVTYPLSGSPIDSSTTITISRVVPLVQQTDIVNQSAFYPETIEDALDYMMMVAQQLQDQISRAIIAPAGSNLDTNSYLQAIISASYDATIAASASEADAVLAAYYASLAASVALGAASAVTYDPTSSGLLATNVQDAIDEIAGSVVASTAFIGQIADSAAIDVPSLWLACDGSAVSRTTYALLWAALNKSATITVTVASPAVFTWNAHGRVNGDPISFSTTGALPTGLTANTVYYIKNKTANTFQVSATPSGSAINTSGSQSGTHTGLYAPWGIGNGTTTFNVPDINHRATYGWSVTAARLTNAVGTGIDGTVLGGAGGVESVTLGIGQIPSHSHTMLAGSFSGQRGGAGFDDVPTSASGSGFDQGQQSTGTAGGSGAHNNVPPGIIVRKIIYAGA